MGRPRLVCLIHVLHFWGLCGELTHRRETEEQREREKRERREKERGREGRGEKGRKERREQGAWGGGSTLRALTPRDAGRSSAQGGLQAPAQVWPRSRPRLGGEGRTKILRVGAWGRVVRPPRLHPFNIIKSRVSLGSECTKIIASPIRFQQFQRLSRRLSRLSIQLKRCWISSESFVLPHVSASLGD